MVTSKRCIKRSDSNTAKRIFILFALLFASFGYGIGVGYYGWFPSSGIKLFVRSAKSFVGPYESPSSLISCSLPKIKVVPNNSIAIIGHAYGSPKAVSDSVNAFLSDTVNVFLKDNSVELDMVIFSGDVFAWPSIAKWDRLSAEFDKQFEIRVAPGNHDVGTLAAADIFRMTEYYSPGPFIILDTQKYVIISENSIKSNGLLSEKTKAVLNEFSEKKIFLVRHNVPIKELVKYSNSPSDVHSLALPKLDAFTAALKHNAMITVISGDGGAYPHLPRELCLEINNLRFVLNGIGELPRDTIAILVDGVLYSYELTGS
jgi:hypothetical protein